MSKGKPDNPSSCSDTSGSVGSSVSTCPKLDIEVELTWLDGHQAAREDVAISGPHWQRSLVTSTTDGNKEEQNPNLFHKNTQAKKPAVYEISTSSTYKNPKIEVKIIGVSGKRFTQDDIGKSFNIKMELGSLKFDPTTFSLPQEGETTTITLNLSEKSKNDKVSSLFTIADDAKWLVEYKGKYTELPQKTRLELFFIYKKPALFFTNGVWVETLRFLFEKAGVKGNKDPAKTAEKITKYCHSSHGLEYHTAGGAPKYCSSDSGGNFELKKYMSKTKGNVINCYDQAAAVQAFCGALGIQSTWIYMNPYGFINKLALVGIGSCNNPFFKLDPNHISTKPVVTMKTPLNRKTVTISIGSDSIAYTSLECTDGKLRTYFGNHAFIKLDQNNNILDACAGPAQGTENLSGYASTAIDKNSTKFAWGRDTVLDVNTYATDKAGVSNLIW